MIINRKENLSNTFNNSEPAISKTERIFHEGLCDRNLRFVSMCYHYSVPNIDGLRDRFHAYIDPPSSFNRIYHVSGFSRPKLPVITTENPARIQFLIWGLIPHWVKDDAIAEKFRTRTLNARAETLYEKASFRHLVERNRCLVLADGFFEWRHYKGRTYPYYITLKNQQPFAFAGLWDAWQPPNLPEVEKTYTIITTKANTLLEQVHNKRKRMPVILSPEHEQSWLTPELSQPEIDALLSAYKPERMQAHPVSRLITAKGVQTNLPDAIQPKEYADLPGLT